MSTAVLSDIHANAEALKRVLDDIDRRKVDRIICLGDTLGYGPDPLECLDLVHQRCAWSLLGNHEAAVARPRAGADLNPEAAASAAWTRAQLDAESDSRVRDDRRVYLAQMRITVRESPADLHGQLLAVHATPRSPLSEYLLPQDALGPATRLRATLDQVRHIAVVGHTHFPGVFCESPAFHPASSLAGGIFRLRRGRRAVINAGSVGQPRDGDPRASYVILRAERAEFARVEYAASVTAARIAAVPELSAWFAQRLLLGR